ncbi:hypothetical protein F8M41_024044 [Gigaspora margarita]|uniref:Uncharacterized protein n=1 Tax=Gigaspora margarita TaxID=4874 RepID=A0A8H4ACE4_GIGMA|nr:hypothetical protein F8M41_024044 [Gigaspora margarita]
MDQRSDFHPTGLKNNVDISSTIISFNSCLFCNQKYHVYSRGMNCKAHAWRLLGKDVLLPCLAVYTYICMNLCSGSSEEGLKHYLLTKLIDSMTVYCQKDHQSLNNLLSQSSNNSPSVSL